MNGIIIWVGVTGLMQNSESVRWLTRFGKFSGIQNEVVSRIANMSIKELANG